jgi:hypothetical protein
VDGDRSSIIFKEFRRRASEFNLWVINRLVRRFELESIPRRLLRRRVPMLSHSDQVADFIASAANGR